MWTESRSGLLLVGVADCVETLRSLKCCAGGRGSLVRQSEFKAEDPGFDPLAEQGEEQFSVSSSQLLCRLVCA